jgi:hypothetical protein
MFDFHGAGDHFDHFMKFCNENIERQMYKEENYKIPLWIMFISNENLTQYSDIKMNQETLTENPNNESSQSANSTSKRLPNAQRSSDTLESNYMKNDLSMISFEVKFILIESLCVSRRKDELIQKIKSLIINFVRNIDRRIMMKILKEKNICDERLFPKEAENLNNIQNNLFQNNIFQNNMFQNNNFHSIHDSFMSKRHTGASAFKNQDLSYLDCQYECKFFSDYDIESVYKALLSHFEKNFKISNREDIFTISQGEEIFILCICLINEEKIKSFHNNDYMKVLTNVNKFKQGLTAEDLQMKAKIFSKKHNVTINLYGLEHPSVNITKIIRDLVNEKLTAVKLRYLASSLLKVEGIKSKSHPDYLFLNNIEGHDKDYIYIAHAHQITEAIKQFTEKAKSSWNKVVNAPEEEIETHDIELISNFSHKLTLEHFFEGFIPLCEMNRNFFENFTEYYKIFKSGSIFSFIFNDSQRILVMSEVESFAFLIKLECNDYEEGSLSHISYELLQMKEVHDMNENLLDVVSDRQDIFAMIMRFLDDLLYVAYLLVITCNSGKSNNSSTGMSMNNSYISSRSNLP